MKGHDWNAVKASVNLPALVGSKVKLTKNKGLCPFHSEKTPSFVVYDDHYTCYGCGMTGDAIDFVMAFENCTHSEAIQKLSGDITLSGEAANRVVKERAEATEHDKIRVIAESRQRWQDAEERPAPESHGYLSAKGVQPHMTRIENNWLLVPVYDKHGQLQCVQKIAPKQDDAGKYAKMFPKDGTMKGGRLNFGINLGRTIVCEGYATGASIYESIPERVTVAFSASGVMDIVRELHSEGLDVAIAADRNAASKMFALGEELDVPVFLPADPHDDFNDMVQALGHDAVAATLRARPSVAPVIPNPEDENDDPVNVWAKNQPPPLPVGMVPPIIERFARIRAEAVGCDPGGLVMSALAVCSAALSDRIKLKVKKHENWTESARLWVMLVGDPSFKKSPMIKSAAAKIKQLDSQLMRQHEKDFQDWREGGENGEMPVSRRLRIEDITMEAAQEVCVSSPDGILALQDELSGWFGGIEKYAGSKGSAKDRSFWLQAYGGGEYAVNRVSRKNILIDNLSIAILGGIQPDAIRRIMVDATDDGLIQRFIPCVLQPSGLGSDEELPDVETEYDALIERLHHMEPPKNFLGDIVLRYDDGAQAIRTEMYKDYHGMVVAMEHINKKMAAHLGKFEGLFPRLCIIWHCIENANAESLPDVITEDTARRVERFLNGYVIKHSMAFYNGVLGLSEDQSIIEDIAGYILAHNLDTISMRTFQRGSTRMRKLTKFQVEPICQQLEAFGWLNEIKSRGDKFMAVVNPRVHELYKERSTGERERRENTVALIRKLAEG